MTGDVNIVSLDVTRYHPDTAGPPTVQRYEVPSRPEWVVLDALNYIKDELDGSLCFRWSCHMGICGSCGVMVNGVPKLACAAFLREYIGAPIRVEALANFPIERDLVIVLDDFMAKLPQVKPWLIRDEVGPSEGGEYRQSPAELAEYQNEAQCINCMLCYSACPVYQSNEQFLGPAVLALAQRYNRDSRDDGEQQRHEVIWESDGVWDCTFVGECSAVCPKGVDPAASIQQAKLESTRAWYRSFFMPFGRK